METDAIVAMTDLRGMITDFVRISGFIRKALIGVSHNAVRHPDRPRECGKSLKAGRLDLSDQESHIVGC